MTPFEQPETQPEAPRVPFGELSLWAVLWLFMYHPRATLRRFFREIALEENPTANAAEETFPLPSFDPPPAPTHTAAHTAPEKVAAPTTQTRENLSPRFLGGLLLALLLAFIGGNRLWSAALVSSLPGASLKGAPFWFALAFLVYVAASLYAALPWWRGERPPSTFTEKEEEKEEEKEAAPAKETSWAAWLLDGVERHSVRLAMMPVGVILAYLSYSQNVVYDDSGTIVRDVVFTANGAWAWLAAIVFWFCILAVDMNAVFYRAYQLLAGEGGGLRPPRMSLAWQHGALLLVLLLAAFFRLHDLDGVPPEMTSDHIEKLLDAVRVYEGYDAMFFPNNAGREAFQMHFIAALVRYAGQEFSFNTLKLASIIEGLLTVALGYVLGVTMMDKDRRMGVWLGLALAALLAVSSWHVMLSRLGLRIALTPLSTMLMLIFLVRAMRGNRRRDFVWLGVVLGAGTYFYQANRMLPLVVVVGVVLAVLVYARTRRDALLYGVNLACAGVMALVIFLPLYRYSEQFPSYFWDRTRGRLFGEFAFIKTDPETGLQSAYEPSLGEQINLLGKNLDVFGDNYADALRMWSWEGDAAWISNWQSRPALDPYTNALFLLGLVGWGVLFFKKWDIAYLLMPMGILIMLLPSALTLAYQIENPSFTRASGTIPFVFLIAAYPLAQLGYTVQGVVRRRALGVVLAGVLMLPVVGLAARVSYDNYFNVYREGYSFSWRPYDSIARPLQDFVTGENGSWGNAFMIAYPHWLDHRILGTVAGDIKWNNGLVSKEALFSFIGQNNGTRYAYNPEQPLFIMYNQNDTETAEWLRQLFPDGQESTAIVAENETYNFNIFLVPPGIDWGAVQQHASELG